MKIVEEVKNNFTEKRVVYNFVMTGARISDVSGGGDMLKSVYDPGNVNGDAFDMENMSEGATNKILSSAGKGAISGSENPATANPFQTLSASQKVTNGAIAGAHILAAADIGKYQTLDNASFTIDASSLIAIATDGQWAEFKNGSGGDVVVVGTYDAKGTTLPDKGSMRITRRTAAAYNFDIIGGLT